MKNSDRAEAVSKEEYNDFLALTVEYSSNFLNKYAK